MKNNTQNRLLRRWTCPALVGAFLVCLTANAPAALLLHMEFDNPNTATTTAVSSVGGYEFDLLNSAGSPTALQTGSGVSGNAGDYSLNGSSATGMGSAGTGPYAQYDSSGPDITTGSLESFTVAGWFRTAGTAQLSGNAKIFSTARLSITGFVESSNSRIQVDFATTSAGQLVAATPSSYTGWNATQEWVFFAFSYDSTVSVGANAFFYMGSIDDPVASASAANLAESAWSGFLDTAPIRMGNDRSGNNRPFDGFLDDFRLYGAATGSSGALSLSELEAVRLQAIPEPSAVGLVAVASLSSFLLRRRRAT